MKLGLIIFWNCLGSGLKCQVCNGKYDECDSDNDNGESKECPMVYASCYYNTNRDNKVTTRSCGPESSKKCQPFRGGYICSCDTDNCNRDRQCECSFSTNKQDTTSATTESSTTSVAMPRNSTTINTNSGLKCQVCGGGIGICDNANDNGASTECMNGFNACRYYQAEQGGQDVTFRMCGTDLGGCVSQDIGGASVTVCSCKTENCNKDQECDCSSSTTIGISAMALLVSAFVLFEME